MKLGIMIGILLLLIASFTRLKLRKLFKENILKHTLFVISYKVETSMSDPTMAPTYCIGDDDDFAS